MDASVPEYHDHAPVEAISTAGMELLLNPVACNISLCALLCHQE